MAYSVGTAFLDIVPSLSGLQGRIESEIRGVNTERLGRDAGEGYSSGVGASVKKLTGVLAGAFALDKLKDFGSEAVAAASDIAESGTKMQQVFSDGTDAVDEFASKGAKSLGQSSLAIKDAAATFGVYGKAAGLAGRQNADFSTALVGLSTDLASFYNTDPSQAVEAIAAGLRGESEPLRQFGVLLDDATLRNKALQLGLISTTKDALTPQQKVLAAQASIMEQTTVAQGDFARTSGGLANQQRILAAQFEDMKGKIGAAFLPAVTATVTALNEKFFPVLTAAGQHVSDFFSVVRSGEGFDTIGGADSFVGKAALMFYGLNETLSGKVIPDLRANMSEIWHMLTTGDFAGGGTFQEDSPIVSFVLGFRDSFVGAFNTVKSYAQDTGAALKTIFTGDFDPSQWFNAPTEDSPLVDFLFNIREAAEKVGASIGPMFQQIKDTIGPVFKEIGSTLGPAVVGTFNKLFDAIAPLVPTILDVVSAFNPFSLIFKALAPVLPKIVDLLSQLVESVGGVLAKALEAVGPLVEKLVGAFMDFVPVLVDALMPILPVIVDVLTDLADVIGDALISAIDALTPLFNTIVDVVAELLPFIADLVKKLLPPLQKLFESLAPAVKAILDALVPLVGQIADALIPVIEALMPIVERVFTFIGDTIGNLVEVFQGVIDFITGVFSGDWDKAWQGIQEIFGGIWDQIKNIFGTLWDVIVEFFTNLGPRLWDIVQSLSKQLVEWGGQFLGWIWQGIQDLWNGTIWPWFQALPGRVWDGIKAAASQMVTWGAEFLSWLWEGITSFFSGTVGPWFARLPGMAWDALVGFVGAGGGWLADRGSELIHWVLDGITTGASDLWNWFIGLPAKAWGILVALKDGVVKIGSDFAHWIIDGIKGAAQAVADAVSSLFNLKLNEDGTGYIALGSETAGGIVPGGARGAVVPGRDPGRRDNVLARLPWGAAFGLRSEEAIMVPEFTHAVGGESGVHRLNRMAEAGRLGEIMGGYAWGGVVPKAKEIGRWVSEGIAGSIKVDDSSALWDHIGDDARLAAGKSSSINVDPGSARGRFIAAMLSKQGTEYVWGAAGPNVFDCSGLVSWALDQAGVGKGRLTAEQFNSSFPKAPEAPGNLVTFDTGRLPGMAGHIGAIVDVARGLMMHTDGAGPARVSDYRSRDGGPLNIVDAIGGGAASGSSNPFTGILSRVKGFIAQAFNNAVGPSGETPGGTDVERWRGVVLQALGLTGQDASLAGYVLHQMDTESSGRPDAINNYDSNAARGIPSKGLMQVIDPTFRSYALPGYNSNIYDPLSNIIASIRYVLARYGSIPAGMQGHAYDTGGWLMPGGTGVNLLNRPEAVLTPTQSEALVTHAKSLQAGYSGQAPTFSFGNIEVVGHRPEDVAAAVMDEAIWRARVNF